MRLRVLPIVGCFIHTHTCFLFKTIACNVDFLIFNWNGPLNWQKHLVNLLQQTKSSFICHVCEVDLNSLWPAEVL